MAGIVVLIVLAVERACEDPSDVMLPRDGPVALLTSP